MTGMACGFIGLKSTSRLCLWGMNLIVFGLCSYKDVSWTSLSVSDAIMGFEFSAVCHSRYGGVLAVIPVTMSVSVQEHNLVLHFILQTGQVQRWTFALDDFSWKINVVMQSRWNGESGIFTVIFTLFTCWDTRFIKCFLKTAPYVRFPQTGLACPSCISMKGWGAYVPSCRNGTALFFSQESVTFPNIIQN